jgi:hypothetical protein
VVYTLRASKAFTGSSRYTYLKLLIIEYYYYLHITLVHPFSMNSKEKVGKQLKFRYILVVLSKKLEKPFRARIPNKSRGLNQFPTSTTMAPKAALLG